jgi:hypothetical protein
MVTCERVAELARELPEIEETTSWGKPSFAVGGKKFAGLSTRHESAMWTDAWLIQAPKRLAAQYQFD